MKRLSAIGVAAMLSLAACGSRDEAQQPTANTVAADHDEEIIVPPEPSANVGEADNAGIAFPALNLAPDGVGVVLEGGSTRHAVFGMPQDVVMRMASAALGEPIERGENEECGPGPLSFANYGGGLTLFFQNGSFAGWDQDGRDSPRLATAAGVGIGSTRRELESANAITVEDSSLGIEFSSGGMSGLLSSRAPDGEITNLWAGATCIAR